MPGLAGYTNNLYRSPFDMLSARGRDFYVDPLYGSNGYRGLTPTTPKLSFEEAYNLCEPYNNDVIHLLVSANASNLLGKSNTFSASFTFAKNFTHIIGHCPPGRYSPRCRLVSSAIFTPLMTFDASGCYVKNVHWFHGQNHATNAAVCLLVTGEKNVFENCHIAGGGHVTAAGNAAMRSLVIDGESEGSKGENGFINCTIGLDTILRANVANSEIELKGGTGRNYFEQCRILKNSAAGASLFLLIGSGGIDRFVEFVDCGFYNAVQGGGGAMTQAFSIHGSAAGNVILRGHCLATNVTASESAASNLLIGSLSTIEAAAVTWS